MTFNFAFATDQHIYLVADRRRTWTTGEQKGTFEDDRTKLHRVNPWTYITGAGFMCFFDDEVVPQSQQALGGEPIKTKAFEQAMPQMHQQLMSLFVDVAKQTVVGDPAELFSKFSVVGVEAGGAPFSCHWNSESGWQEGVRVGRRHQFFLPHEIPTENHARRAKIDDLQGRALRGAGVKDIVGGAQEILAWVASRDDGVSATGDMAIIGSKGSELIPLE